MSNSTSQLHEEIKILTSEVEHLEIEISSNRQPNSVCQPCGLRWLSLSPYKRAKSFFEDWDEKTKGSNFIRTPGSEMSESECLSDSRISNLGLTRSDSEHKADELEHARCRVLGILRCYLFNLETGTLVTEDRVDRAILNRLKGILEISTAGDDHGASSKSSEVPSGQLLTQEEGSVGVEFMVVEMIDGYISQVKSCGSEVDREVVEVARKILDKAKLRGGLLEGIVIETQDDQSRDIE